MGRELGRRSADRGGFDEIRRLERERANFREPSVAAVLAAARSNLRCQFLAGISMTLGCLRSSDVRLIQGNVRTQSKLCVGSAAAPNLFIKNIRAITPGASTAATP